MYSAKIVLNKCLTGRNSYNDDGKFVKKSDMFNDVVDGIIWEGLSHTQLLEICVKATDENGWEETNQDNNCFSKINRQAFKSLQELAKNSSRFIIRDFPAGFTKFLCIAYIIKKKDEAFIKDNNGICRLNIKDCKEWLKENCNLDPNQILDRYLYGVTMDNNSQITFGRKNYKDSKLNLARLRQLSEKEEQPEVTATQGHRSEADDQEEVPAPQKGQEFVSDRRRPKLTTKSVDINNTIFIITGAFDKSDKLYGSNAKCTTKSNGDTEKVMEIKQNNKLEEVFINDYRKTGYFYAGQILNGKPCGVGTKFYKTINAENDFDYYSIEGVWMDNNLCGEGFIQRMAEKVWSEKIWSTYHNAMMMNNGSEVNSGRKNVLYISEGTCYIGEVLNGKPHGKGTMYNYQDGISIDGNWIHGDLYGNGSFTIEGDGDAETQKITQPKTKPPAKFNNTISYQKAVHYIGESLKRKPHGKGTMFYPQEGISIKGSWINGDLHGNGSFIIAKDKKLKIHKLQLSIAKDHTQKHIKSETVINQPKIVGKTDKHAKLIANKFNLKNNSTSTHLKKREKSVNK